MYLEKCFDFEQVTVKKFRTWAERRQFNRDMKRKQAESERPILPANQKLITLSVQDAPTKKGICECHTIHVLRGFFLACNTNKVCMISFSCLNLSSRNSLNVSFICFCCFCIIYCSVLFVDEFWFFFFFFGHNRICYKPKRKVWSLHLAWIYATCPKGSTCLQLFWMW